MSGIAGYTHNVGPEDVAITAVDIRAQITVSNTFTVTVEVQ